MEKEKLTIERKVYLENWLNDHFPDNFSDIVYQEWRGLFSDAEATYLYRAFYLPISLVKRALSNKVEFLKLYRLPVITEAINMRLKEVPEILAYLKEILTRDTTEQVYNKLVRDKIADNITANGEIPVTRILNAEEYWECLCAKDKEELEEVKKAQTKAEICEELADKLAVLMAMAEYHGLTIFEVEQAEILKRDAKGGFTRRLYLEKVITKK